MGQCKSEHLLKEEGRLGEYKPQRWVVTNSGNFGKAIREASRNWGIRGHILMAPHIFCTEKYENSGCLIASSTFGIVSL